MKRLIYTILIITLFVISCKKDDINNNGVVENLDGKAISALIVDNSNTRWVGTDDGLYKSVDGGYKLENSDITGKILSIGYDAASNTLWIGTSTDLLKATIAAGDITVTPVNATQLSSNQVNAACVDSSSNVWFGTNDGITMNKSGVFKKENFLTNELGDELKLEIENAEINNIAFWDGDYYFATNGYSLYRAYGYDEQVDAFTGASALGPPYNGMSITDTMFTVFVDSKGRQWMGGTNGLQCHTGHDTRANNTSYKDELPDSRIRCVAEAPDGKIWIGTENGISIFDGTGWNTSTTDLPDKTVTAIAFDLNNNAWIGTKKGLVRISY